ncbi:MAG: alpha/beta hydrolase [Dehalococcoidia bacterium]
MAEQQNPEERDNPRSQFSIGISEVLSVPPYEGDLGEGLIFRTDRGNIQSILHRADAGNLGVIWVCGARGGFGGPGPGTYSRLAESFREQGISSIRLNYRQPNVFPECVLDLLAGVAFFRSTGHEPVVVVGHSFGGAVVIAAGALSSHIRGVVSLSPQTYGANMAGQLAPRPLLVVHGKADSRLPYSCGAQVYDWAQEPKQLVLYEGAEHRLEECREELEELLGQWIPATLSREIKGLSGG